MVRVGCFQIFHILYEKVPKFSILEDFSLLTASIAQLVEIPLRVWGFRGSVFMVLPKKMVPIAPLLGQNWLLFSKKEDCHADGFQE